MHGSVEELANYLTNALIERDIKVMPYHIMSGDLGNLAMSLIDAATIVLGCSQFLATAHPAVANIAYIANVLRPKTKFASIIGSYGWGGKMMTRDCSATTRDFFAVFGIFLKRNSAKQAKEGKKIRIKGLPKAKKKAAILQYAKPFRSLLYVPGHITLYLGRYKGEPVIMHTYWGIRLKDWSKYPLCRTIITTTEPGKELRNIRERSKLINTLQQINTF